MIVAAAVNPHVSIRKLSREFGKSGTSILRILGHRKFHPYHISLVQELYENYFQTRVVFCKWAREKIQFNADFPQIFSFLLRRISPIMGQ